ncbi:hypothetical protein NL676_033161 [Syzygium grande]|nr:hypothetical protein NL676_033161 [Syzygium grande]
MWVFIRIEVAGRAGGFDPVPNITLASRLLSSPSGLHPASALFSLRGRISCSAEQRTSPPRLPLLTCTCPPPEPPRWPSRAYGGPRGPWRRPIHPHAPAR